MNPLPMQSPQVLSTAMGASKAIRSERFLWLVAFLMGLGLFINVRISVRLSLTELCWPFFFVSLSTMMATVQANRVLRNAILFLFLHMIAVALSDFIADVPADDFRRSIAKPIFILGLLVNFSLLFAFGTRYIIPLWIGLVCSTALHMFFNSSGDPYDYSLSSMQYAFYVFRVMPFVGLFASLACYFYYDRFKPLAILALLTSAGLSVFLSGRSAIFAYLLAIGMVLYSMWIRTTPWEQVLRPGRSLLQLGLISVVVAMGSFYMYTYIATQGLLGDSAKQKSNMRELDNKIGYGPIGLIMSGRAETVASLLMIMDSPIFGHGSTSAGGAYYLKAFQLAGVKKFEEKDIPGIQYGRVNGGHSIVFSHWAANGLLTVPFWGYVVIRLIRLAIVLCLAKDPLIGLFAILFAGMSWDLVFSPLSVMMRSYVPMILAFSAFYVPLLEAKARAHLSRQYTVGIFSPKRPTAPRPPHPSLPGWSPPPATR
jgi:hypothetical protein